MFSIQQHYSSRGEFDCAFDLLIPHYLYMHFISLLPPRPHEIIKAHRRIAPDYY
jgi:hypothetical protein